MRDYIGEAKHESASRDATYRWVKARTENLLAAVSAYDVLRRNGVQLRHEAMDREEQFCCPFHGVDTHPSARVYPTSANGPSHVWCFVCRKRWDSIGLWRMFAGAGQDVKFTKSLAEMERAFGILPPDRPPSRAEMEEHENPEADQCAQKLEECESYLRNGRDSFDMRSHLTVGGILDRVRYHLEHRTISFAKAGQVLDQVFAKVNEKAKACPDG